MYLYLPWVFWNECGRSWLDDVLPHSSRIYVSCNSQNSSNTRHCTICVAQFEANDQKKGLPKMVLPMWHGIETQITHAYTTSMKFYKNIEIVAKSPSFCFLNQMSHLSLLKGKTIVPWMVLIFIPIQIKKELLGIMRVHNDCFDEVFAIFLLRDCTSNVSLAAVR
jgi:hypothetical protein